MPRSSRSFTARDQFLCMAFAQLTFRESLRDIEACLGSQADLLYAMRIRGSVTRTNLAYANEHRSWKVYFELAQILIRKVRKLYSSDRYILDLDEVVYTMIDLSGSIPVFIAITDGKVHDVNALDWIAFEAGAFYVLDRGYVDFLRLAAIHSARAFFVTRAKTNMSFYVRESREGDKSTGLRSDQTVRLNGTKTKEHYPHDLRRVSFRDAESGRLLVFITNNFEIDALIVAMIYKARWSRRRGKLFFKWIKQNLRVKSFFGLSPACGTVKTQIWIAVCTYLIVAMASRVASGSVLNKTLRIEQSMSRILQVLSVYIFSHAPIHQLLMQNNTRNSDVENSNH